MKTLFLTSCFLLAGLLQHAAAQSGPGVLIRVEDDRLEVEQVRLPLSRTLARSAGLIVWSEDGLDRWAALPLEQSPTKSRRRRSARRRSSSGTRGQTAQATQAMAMLTVQLDQLIGGEVLRAVEDGGLITPSDDVVHLTPKLTFRRLVTGGELPADEFSLKGDGGLSLKIPFSAGQNVLSWADIPDLPEDLRNGLPTGEYSIESQDGRTDIAFYVEEAQVRSALLEPIERLTQLVGSEHDPLVLQFAIEQLVDPTNIGEDAESYVVDAYDRVTAVPAEKLTPFLAQVRVALRDRLTGARGEPAAARQSPDETGIADIDLARRRIAGGRWDDAMQLLETINDSQTPREGALALLYQAVILAESGQTTGNDAQQMFVAAIDQLRNAEPADLFRAHNNFGNFLLRRAQDRLYNHSIRIASGVANPLLGGLVDWCDAQHEYLAAQKLAESLGPRQQAGVAANIARLYSQLADFVRVLNSTLPAEKRFSAGENTATQAATAAAHSAVQAAADDAGVRAVALEILAHLAHRRREADQTNEHAQQALAAYLDGGALAGAESIQRLLGLAALRGDGGAASDEITPAARATALQHFQIADLLAQSLRDRFPADSIGLTRAGFLARRAYVNEQIVQLLVDNEDYAAALRFLETAKARSLQDVLLLDGTAAANEKPQTTATSDILADWPADVTALEYFLGTERPLVFFVDRSGKVSVHQLQDEAGQPLASAELVARIQQFLYKIEATASKMLRLASSGRGFDAKWQDELHTFYNQLVPEAVRGEIAESGRLLVVPHHILHYFPFSALVTDLDTSEHSNYEMPMPEFWIEQPLDLWYAPSLAIWRLMREDSPAPSESVNAVGIVDFSQAQSLPGVERDLAHLKQTFGDRLKQVVDREGATEANVRDVFDKPGMLFVATHGMNVADQPLASYLLCHSGQKDDGRLTAGEIFTQHVSSEIVVLSACYSGLADRSPLPGDDLFGLERALLQSGALTVVAGLWDVYDDAGAEIMHEFFKQMAGGRKTAESLLNAQRHFIAKRREEGPSDPWIHPYFWAVYKTTGSDLTRLSPQN